MGLKPYVAGSDKLYGNIALKLHYNMIASSHVIVWI